MRIEIPQLPQTTSERIPSYPLRSTPCCRQSSEQKCLLYLFLTDFTRVRSNYTLLSTHQLRALESPFEERGRSTDTEREGSGESCHRRCLLSSSSSSFFCHPFLPFPSSNSSSPSFPTPSSKPTNEPNQPPPRSLAPQDFPFSAGAGRERQAPIWFG